LRERLWTNAVALREGLSALGFDIASPMGPILAIRMADEETAVFAWNRLLAYGVYVNLALPPGTPNNLCILRCSLSAAHTLEQIDQICHRFAAVAQELRLRLLVNAAE
jgi:8-amino-7-oxononanoate synthase